MTLLPKPVQDYIDIVKTEKIHKVCKEQKLLVNLIEDIFRNEDLICDDDKFNKYMTYQKYFPFELLPWEKFIFYLHICVYKQNGQPRFPDMFVLVGRGSGKNGYLSFLCFCLITETNGIQEYDIDISANSEEQAKTSFNDIWNILENPKWKSKMKSNFRWNREEIVNKKTNSKIKYRTNSPKGKDGLRSAMVCFDEVHVYENWDNINVFTTGLGKKPHPRRIYITTDGEVRGAVIDELKEKAQKILNRTAPDNGFCPFICKLDNEEEADNEDNWFKANPSLYQNIGLLEQIRKEYQDYKDSPYVNISFMTKRMNIPKQSGDIEVTSWDNILATNRPVPDLTGYECTVGIDYTKTSDLMSACLLFRKSGKYYTIQHSWLCKASNDLKRIKAPIYEWEKQGLLTIVDDVEISPNILLEWLEEQERYYDFVRFGVDNFRYTLLSDMLKELDVNVKSRDELIMVRPSDIMKIVPVIDSLLNKQELIVGNNALWRWCANNTKLVDNGKGNFTYDKIEPKSRKTDAFMAFVHAMIASIGYLEDNDDDFFPDIDLSDLLQ